MDSKKNPGKGWDSNLKLLPSPRDVLYRALAFVEEEYGDRFPRHAGAEEQGRSGIRATTERCIKT